MPCPTVLLSLCQGFKTWRLVNSSLFRYIFVGENSFVPYNALIFGLRVDHLKSFLVLKLSDISIAIKII